MAATTRAAGGSHARRSLVWSHNTTHIGAAGVHSEVSRNAHALHVTNQRELSSNLSTSQSLHGKELQSLHQNRKLLESSMLAYAEKMSRISKDRLQLGDPAGGQNNSTLERLLSRNKAANGSSANTRSRISVDSGIDLEDETPQMDDVISDSPSTRISEMLATKGSVTTKKSASQPTFSQRPSSFNTQGPPDDSSQSPVNFERRRRVTTDQTNSGRCATRQRRSGTTDKPDILALKLSMGRPDQQEEDDSFSPVASDVSVAITPFPEFRMHLTEAHREGKFLSSVVYDDEARSQGTVSRTSQSSVKKSKTRKNNYWSYRKSPSRHSTTPRSGASVKNQGNLLSPKICPTPGSNAKTMKPIRGLIRGPKPEKPKFKPFHQSFRYSEAVEGVIKSIDASKGVDEKTLRRASEILPSLDVHDLRQERKRLQEEPKRAIAEAQLEELVSANNEDSESPQSQDLLHSWRPEGASCEEDLATFAREYSMSVPDILDHNPDSECVSEEEGEWELKPVLRKYDSVDQTGPAASRKTVQFLLPELSRETHTNS